MAVGAFAEGLVTGFVQGKKMKQEREKHDLEMARAQDEKDMRDAFKAVEKEHDIEERFSVATADGEQIFTDLAAAQEAAGKDGAVQALFSVAGTSYEDMHSAQMAQDMVNSPSSRMGQYAAIAMHYGRPEMATQFHGAQVSMIDAQRRTMQQAFLHARRTGNIEGVINQINHMSGPNGPQTQLVQGEGGGIVMQRVNPKDGSVVSEQPFQDLEGVWNHVYEDMMTTEDNMLPAWTSKRNMEHMQEQFAWQKENAAANRAIAAGHLSVAQQTLAFNKGKPTNVTANRGVGPDGNQTVAYSYLMPGEDGTPELVVTPGLSTGSPPLRTGGTDWLGAGTMDTGPTPEQRAQAAADMGRDMGRAPDTSAPEIQKSQTTQPDLPPTSPTGGATSSGLVTAPGETPAPSTDVAPTAVERARGLNTDRVPREPTSEEDRSPLWGPKHGGLNQIRKSFGW